MMTFCYTCDYKTKGLDNYIFAILTALIPKGHFITTIKPLSLSHGHMTLAESRGFYLYVEVLTTALNDGIVTDDEASILKVLSTALGVSPANTGAAMDIARGIDKSPFSDANDFASHKIGDATTYQSALVAALDDEVISEDEWAMLNELRTIFGIQPDQHALIEEAIRSMSEEDENGERRLERLARYNILCPYS